MTLESKLVQLDISDLAFDGKSVGHLDGKVVFCDRGLPGETVLAEITRSKPRYNQATVREIIRKTDARIPPVCSHFGHCGGCLWQDLSYQEQLRYKRKQVVDCLERLGGLSSVQVADAVGAPEQFHYRNKMEFSFHVTPEGGFSLGLHRRGRFDDVFDLERCYLQSELSNEIVAWMRDFVTKERIPVYDVRHHTGFIRFLVIREGKHTGQVMVNIVTNYGDIPGQDKLVTGLTGTFPAVTTIVHNQNGQKSNVATGEIETVLYGPGYIEEEICTWRFRIRTNSFFQTNSIQTGNLYRTALDMLGAKSGDRLLDLYCGTGTISILASLRVSEVVGVELVGESVAVARENAELNDTENILFFQADVQDFLKSPTAAEKRFEIVVVDPPRAGLHPRVLRRILRLVPEKLLYISCNPATFARDAREVTAAGYALSKVIPVDMFPHTKHIELVAMFHRM